MTWQRIDEDTFIDDTLVTCAEYQLFIDEMREQGKYNQPDHWVTYQFPAGQALKPILGMRYSDAMEFCKWVSNQGSRNWVFRLPTQIDAQNYPIEFIKHDSIGYWILDDSKFSLIELLRNNGDVRLPDFEVIKDLVNSLKDTKAFSLTYSIQLADTISFLKHNDPYDDFRYYDLIKNKVFDLDTAFEFNLNKSLNFDRLLSRNLNAGHNISQAFDLAAEINQEIEETYNLIHNISESLNSIYRSSGIRLDSNQTVRFIRNIEKVHSITSRLKSNLLIIKERVAGESHPFEGIRLVREQTT